MRTTTFTRIRSATVVLIALATAGLAACGSDTSIESSEDPSAANPSNDPPTKPVDSAGEDKFPQPPGVRVLYGEESVDLAPWTFCYESMCADGMPPSHPPDVGSPEQVVVEYALDDWTFKANFVPAGQPCGRGFPATLEEIEPGRFALRPAGYAGDYDVTLSGRGPEGDAFVTFRWTTPSHGPLPSPSAYVGIISDHDGEADSYGVEMSVSQLAETPEQVDATVTVTAADGDSLTFSPRLTRSNCRAEGSLYWDGPNAKGKEAARLGPAPFTYDVELVLAGQTYQAHATWPDDVIRGASPYVRLDFSPDLPALS